MLSAIQGWYRDGLIDRVTFGVLHGEYRSGRRASEPSASQCSGDCIMSIGGPHEVLPPYGTGNRVAAEPRQGGAHIGRGGTTTGARRSRPRLLLIADADMDARNNVGGWCRRSPGAASERDHLRGGHGRRARLAAAVSSQSGEAINNGQ